MRVALVVPLGGIARTLQYPSTNLNTVTSPTFDDAFAGEIRRRGYPLTYLRNRAYQT
jgi:hypothetical protein